MAWRLFSVALAVLAYGKTFPLGSMVLCVVPTFLPALCGTMEQPVRFCAKLRKYQVNLIKNVDKQQVL